VTIPATELKRLFARSGNRCAFSDCRRVLVVEGPPGEQPVILGDVAHIVAASPAGPRGDPFMAPANRLMDGDRPLAGFTEDEDLTTRLAPEPEITADVGRPL
jgi:hypothetical protein